MTATIRVRHLVSGEKADLSLAEWESYQKTPLKDVYEVIDGDTECLTCGEPENEPETVEVPVVATSRKRNKPEENEL